MSDKVEVKPTPIQRNTYDVATDLTKMYYEKIVPNSVEEVQEAFIKFYAIAKKAHNTTLANLENFVPEKLK